MGFPCERVLSYKENVNAYCKHRVNPVDDASSVQRPVHANMTLRRD